VAESGLRLRTAPTIAWLSGLDDPDRVALGLRLCRVLGGAEKGASSGVRSANRVAPPAPRTPRREAYDILRASREELFRLSAVLRDAASSKRRRCPDPGLAQLLTGVALERLRRYDLILACVVLRGAAAVALPDDPDLEEAALLLSRQQRPDGAFGFFARPGPAEDPAAALALYLPVTLHCLWTIAALTRPDFDLARGITALTGRSAALDSWIGR
jgi:hypothetical protein